MEDSKENNFEVHEFKVPVNSNTISKQDSIDSGVAPQKCQFWQKMSPTTKAILILILCGIGLTIVSFSTCLIGRHVKFCPLPNYSHENLEHFGECKNETKDEEEAEVELCLNEQPSNVNEANVIGTLKSGWPACQGTLTLTNSNSEEKVYKLKAKANKIRGFKKIKNIEVVKLDGTCCVDIFKSSNFRSNKQNLWPGSEKKPNFRTIGSFKYGYCNDY